MAKSAKTYKQLSAELAAIIEWFESDDIELDEAIKKYEQATKLVTELENYLKTAENKVRKISAKFDK